MWPRYSADASRRSWHSPCAPWQVEQMFIIRSAPSTCWASANVRALSVSASSGLCSAMTPAPVQQARSSSTSSMSSIGAILAIEPWSSGVNPRLTQPGQYATFIDGCPFQRSALRLWLRPSSGVVLRVGGARSLDALTHGHGSVVLVGARDVQVVLEPLLAVLDGVVDVLDLLQIRGRDAVGL